MSLEDVLVGLDAGSAHYATSLDAPAAGAEVDEPQALLETLGGSEDGFGLSELSLSLRAAITRLPYQQRRALRLRLAGDLRQVDIADHLGCSQMQVSRLLNQAAAKLRTLMDPDV